MRTCLATLTTAATTPAGGGGGERGEKERGKAVNSPRFSMTHLPRGWGGVGEEGREAEKKKRFLSFVLFLLDSDSCT